MLEMKVELQEDHTIFKKNLLRVAIATIVVQNYARDYPKPRVRDSKYFMEQMLLAEKDEAGVFLSNEHNDFLIADAAQLEEIKELSVNICMMAIIQSINIDFDEGPSYDSAFISKESRFLRILDNKKEEGELMRRLIDKGPYERKSIPNPNKESENIPEPISKMTELNKQQYFADIKVMNYLLQGIHNDI
ncbi:hypothetical protein Tco_0612299 [Tanacetum coccineum]